MDGGPNTQCIKAKVFTSRGLEWVKPVYVTRCMMLCVIQSALLVAQDRMSSSLPRKHVFLCHKTFLLASQEDMSSFDTKRRTVCLKRRTLQIQKNNNMFVNIYGWTNLRTPKVKHISLLYHVFPDPLNSIL